MDRKIKSSLGMKKEILILCKSALHRDPRVLKQIAALHKQFNLTCVGLEKSFHEGVKNDLDLFCIDTRSSSSNRITQITKLITKQYRSLYWSENNKSVYEKLVLTTYDIIICNETESLPIAHRLASQKHTPIYCDLHEYYMDDRKTGSFSKAQQQYEEWIFTNHISYVKHFTTVSPQIVDLYKEKYNISCSLLDNACKFYKLSPSHTTDNTIRIISHGAAIPSRRLELMIESVTALDKRYSLDLYLINNNPTYKQYLKQLVENNNKVSILDAIPFNEIQQTINQYDIGLYLLFPTHLNNTYALPNKIFEFIQGRVAIVIGPTPAMADLVEMYNIGVVSEDFTAESLTSAIKSLSVSDIDQRKLNTNLAARERNSEKNIKKIQEIIADLLD